MKGYQLSLLVCSNREKQNYNLIWKKIKQNNLLKIILVTQGKARNHLVQDYKVTQIKDNSIGRSNAVNRGLKEISSPLIGLTDDDCLLDSNWVKQAQATLSDKTIDLVYGQTLSYQPQKHTREVCPCTFSKKPNKFSITKKKYHHWIDVGFDNNVVIRKKVFDNIGGYKPWLGPGSVGKGADDAEFILRAIIAGYNIAYNPKMIVYHNKWLSQNEWLEQQRVYWSGGIAAYGFYAFQGIKECNNGLLCHLQEAIRCLKEKAKLIIKDPFQNYQYINDIMLDIFYFIKGLLLAFIYALIIPISSAENVVRRFYKK